MQDLVFVDFETTGLDAFEDEVVEMSIMRLSHEQLMNVDALEHAFTMDDVQTYRMMPDNPERAFRVPLGMKCSAADINGFDVDKWQDESDRYPLYSWSQIMDLTAPLFKDAKWCGMNAQFDYFFFLNMCRLHKIFPPPLGDYHLCDISTFGHLFMLDDLIPSVSLNEMCKYFNLQRMNLIHTSQEDVYLTARVCAGVFDKFI